MLTINNTIDGAIQDIEIKGNTVQDPNNLADIKSVGVLQEDGTYKMSILSCGKNLISLDKIVLGLIDNSGLNIDGNNTRVEYIKIKPNTSYILSRNGVARNANIFYYDKNKQFINKDSIVKPMFTTPLNCMFIKLYFGSSLEDNIQLEEGTVATSYEPYQENKCDILLPCQLEKVGDVSDRLYYDDVEKAWCIEKNINRLVCDGNSVIEKYNTDSGSEVNTIAFKVVLNKHLPNGSNILGIISNMFTPSNAYVKDVECVGINTTSILIRVNKTKLISLNTDGFKKWITLNPLLAIYQLATPQKIVLPLDVQIALNSFFGTTHVYMESGEVEGTIKCKIPKSLGATVQSLNNKTDILSDRIEAIEGLKDSQNMKYETDKGYLVCKETKNGVIDDLKIEGRTIKNLLGNQAKESITLNNSMKSKLFTLLEPIKAGTEIFIRVNITAKKAPLNGLKVNTYNADGSYSYFTGTTGVYEQMFSIKPTQDISKLGFYMPQSEFDNDVSANITFKEAQVTLINVGTGYFEGLMSVGQDVDKIEVLSCNENLFDMSYLKGFSYDAYKKMYKQNTPSPIYSDFKIKLIKGITYNIGVYREIYNPSNNNYYNFVLKDSLGRTYLSPVVNQIAQNNKTVIQTFTPQNTDFYTIAFNSNNGDTNGGYYIKNIFISSNLSGYEPHQSDKKQILFYNENGELEPITELHEWDSIEKHSDNKWYYHKRSGKRSYQAEDENNSNYITDMTNTVYQLAQEEVYELAPLHLDSYANETLILCNSGAISPKMEFSITSHINELVKAYGERVNLLEEKVYEYIIAQNRMQLASTYSTDSVTFKVDYFSLCGDEENYDEDLYNLILNNILVGKDNYNYDKMFTIVLDYASWNQISWEQFDILVGLMDMQHNPPVEEEITEDEFIEETPVE